MQNAERRMHCLLAVSFTCVCLRLAFICWKGQHFIVFGPFQQIKANRKQTQVKLTASKQPFRRSAFCIRRSAFYPCRSPTWTTLKFQFHETKYFLDNDDRHKSPKFFIFCLALKFSICLLLRAVAKRSLSRIVYSFALKRVPKSRQNGVWMKVSLKSKFDFARILGLC